MVIKLASYKTATGILNGVPLYNVIGSRQLQAGGD